MSKIRPGSDSAKSAIAKIRQQWRQKHRDIPWTILALSTLYYLCENCDRPIAEMVEKLKGQNAARDWTNPTAVAKIAYLIRNGRRTYNSIASCDDECEKARLLFAVARIRNRLQRAGISNAIEG